MKGQRRNFSAHLQNMKSKTLFDAQYLASFLGNVKKAHPLIHNITNYVTVNDCANILLACKASPIMSDAPEEAEEITTLSSGLNINIGTLNSRTIEAMRLSVEKATELGHPIILDPVGAGASVMRTETAADILKRGKITVIRSNASELKALALGSGVTFGVDVSASDAVSEDKLDEMLALIKNFAKRSNSIIAMTGEIDIVADAETVFIIRNGHQMMSMITGSGCMLSAVVTAFVAASPDCPLAATAAAVCTMGICGQRAYKRLLPADGNASFRNYMIDEMFNMTEKTFMEEALFEIR